MQNLTLNGMNSKQFPFFGEKKKGPRGGVGVVRETYIHTHNSSKMVVTLVSFISMYNLVFH